MSLQLFIFFISICVLLYSADVLVDAVKSLAVRLGVSPYVIGLTVVAIGTSLPEVMASSVAAYRGVPDISIGNVIGSNICNVGLIIGLPALFFSISCSRNIIAKQGLFMLLVSGIFSAICLFGSFTRLTGVLFIAVFALFLFFAFRGDAGLEEEELSEAQLPEKSAEARSLPKTLLMVLGAFAFLLLSSHFLVESSIFLARYFSIPEAVIALLLISFGTSVPELSVSFAAARQKQGELLIGNILGSNISNILLVIGASSIISPFSAKQALSGFELPFMGILAVLMCIYLWRPAGVGRLLGSSLLLIYAAFVAFCYSAA